MDVRNKVVDVSSFFLFEATGDSEAGYFDPAMSVINHAIAQDDAESSSCDTTTSNILPDVREVDNSLEVDNDDDHHEDEEKGDQVVDQKEVDRHEPGVPKQNKSSSVSVDSTQSMNEMEKNKLFWEACLAS
ncbi:hypothetical protein PTKIN_Ptkin15bG0082100 [Pterospermum kingtungense]